MQSGNLGTLTPPKRLAEFFGLWGLPVKLSSILGPLTYGGANWLSAGNHRMAMLLTGSYFVVGLVERRRRADSADSHTPISQK
jgi:UMF1 family MFS transporter